MTLPPLLAVFGTLSQHMRTDMIAYLWVPLEIPLSNIKGCIELVTSDFVRGKYPEGARVHFDYLSHIIAHATWLSKSIPSGRKTKLTLSYLRLPPPHHDQTSSIQEFWAVWTHGTLPTIVCEESHLLTTQGTYINHSHPPLLVFRNNAKSLAIDNSLGLVDSFMCLGSVWIHFHMEKLFGPIWMQPFLQKFKLLPFSTCLRKWNWKIVSVVYEITWMSYLDGLSSYPLWCDLPPSSAQSTLWEFSW